MRKFDTALLKDAGAFPSDLRAFHRAFPDGVPEDKDEAKSIAVANASNLDFDFAAMLLSPSAQKAYNKARASAEKAYDEAVAPARKTYNKAVASARKAYDEAVTPAQKVYDEARASARKAYREARASAENVYVAAHTPAQKAYSEAFASAFVDAWFSKENEQ